MMLRWGSKPASRVFAVGFALLSASYAQAFPTLAEVRAKAASSEARLVDRRGEVIHELRVDEKQRRLEWVALGDMSPKLREAVVRSEDRDFWSHHGVNWGSLIKAGVQSLMGRARRGASTISMQVASMLDPTLAPARVHRHLDQKIKQVLEARTLEREWAKGQILEAYLNLVSFRGELHGIAAASEGLFGKAPHGLDAAEAVILAALIRSPEAAAPALKRRACELGEAFKISCATIEAAAERALSRPPSIHPAVALAPHVARLLLDSKARGPQVVRTTLDGRLQRFAIESLRRHVLSIRGQNAHDAAALVVDNASGEVLAYVGSLGDIATAREVDGVRARRQAGSTLKPFLYATAFDHKLLTPGSLLDDSPVEIPVAGGVYRPRNYDQEFHGLVPVREALASSLNVPAVRALELVGIDSMVATMTAAGFTGLRDAGYYGPSLALGSADVTLWDLVGAYRTLANQGRFTPLSLTPVDARPKAGRAFSAQAAFLVSDILSDRESRAMTFGLENPLASRFWTAAKTGTSKDMRDNWCLGYSERYTVGVWVGNASGEPMWDVTGISGAGPAWAEIMDWLHATRPSRALHAPRGLVRAADQHWYMADTEPVTSGPGSGARIAFPRITYPTENMRVAIDPDIPVSRQRIRFAANARRSDLHWVLNGRDLGGAERAFDWKPAPGRFELSLASVRGEIADRVHFTVGGREEVADSPLAIDEGH